MTEHEKHHFWFKAKVSPTDDQGVMISVPGEPLSFIWQSREQAEEIIARIRKAIDTLPGDTQ